MEFSEDWIFFWLGRLVRWLIRSRDKEISLILIFLLGRGFCNVSSSWIGSDFESLAR